MLIRDNPKTDDAIASLKISGYSGTITVPPDPTIPETTEKVVTTPPITVKTDRDDISNFSCVEAAENEYFVLSPRPVPQKSVIGSDDPGHNKADVTLDPKKVCVTVWTHTSCTGCTQQITAQVSVTKKTVTYK